MVQDTHHLSRLRKVVLTQDCSNGYALYLCQFYLRLFPETASKIRNNRSSYFQQSNRLSNLVCLITRDKPKLMAEIPVNFWKQLKNEMAFEEDWGTSWLFFSLAQWPGASYLTPLSLSVLILKRECSHLLSCHCVHWQVMKISVQKRVNTAGPDCYPLTGPLVRMALGWHLRTSIWGASHHSQNW